MGLCLFLSVNDDVKCCNDNKQSTIHNNYSTGQIRHWRQSACMQHQHWVSDAHATDLPSSVVSRLSTLDPRSNYFEQHDEDDHDRSTPIEAPTVSFNYTGISIYFGWSNGRNATNGD